MPTNRLIVLTFRELEGLGSSSAGKSSYRTRNPGSAEFDPWFPHKNPDVVAFNSDPSSPIARWETEAGDSTTSSGPVF